MIDVILDIDSVGDDILAVIYTILNKNINLMGITTVNGASGSIEQATNVALNTVALTGADIPVYKGAAQAIEEGIKDKSGDPVNFDQELKWKFGDRLKKFNTQETVRLREPEKLTAEEFLIQSFNKRPGEITLVTTGTLTNIAKVIMKDPSIAKKIKHTYMLGGTFKVPGNITPVVEYNIWADPEAAKIVLNSGMKITLVPLDVCETNEFASSMLTRDHLTDLQYYGSGKIIDYIVDKFPIYIDLWREFFQLSGFPMDDVITVALSADEDLCEYTPYVYVDVELEGKISRGQTVAYFGKQILKVEGQREKNVRIAKSIDGKRFMNLFIDTLIKN